MSDNAKIQNLKNIGVIEQGQEAKYYVWQQSDLETEELTSIKLSEGSFFIVNYETEEVIYSEGFEDSEGNVHYKLSETLEL